jgi:hypothetical protein
MNMHERKTGLRIMVLNIGVLLKNGIHKIRGNSFSYGNWPYRQLLFPFSEDKDN